MRRLRLFLVPLLLALACPVLWAQTASVHWDPPGGTLATGQATVLKLVYENCAPKDNAAPTLPAVNGLSLQFAGRSTSGRISFGTPAGAFTQTSTELTYGALLTGNQPVTIPTFAVETDKGRLTVPAANYAASAATIGNTAISLDAVVQSRFALPADTVWAGEVFPLAYQLTVLRRYPSQLAGNPEWDSAPLVTEGWPKQPSASNVTQGGEPREMVTYDTRAYAKRPGTVAFKPVSQLVYVQTGVQNSLFSAQPIVQQFSITSAPASLIVKPLPAPAPANFSGAVGQFSLVAKAVPLTAAVGEPITWTLTLDGTGNWPDLASLPPRNVSRDFRVVSPQAKRTPAEGKLFDVNLAEDIVLIPTKPGTYTLGPVTMACFDPKTGQYKNITTEKFTVTVTGAAPVSAGAQEPGNSASTATTPPASPTPPAGIPRDPLPAAPPTSIPLGPSAFYALLLAPFALLPALWLGLALRRAWETDPLRPARSAHRRLAATIAKIQVGSDAQLLHHWRADTATLFGVTHAEPTAVALENNPTSAVPQNGAPALLSRSPSTLPASSVPTADWQSLWHDTDRALYGKKSSLPSDWLPRAEAALAATRIPRFQPLRLFLPRNLFPLATLLLLSLSPFSPFPAPVHAAAPADTTTAAYREGKFDAAEKSARSALDAAPTDWTAHHNLSLALAQQSRWPESAAHALAAFVQQPQNPATLWHLDLALKNAGWMPDATRPFLAAAPLARLAARAPPAWWQAAALIAALLAAAAPALFLWHAYGARYRWLKPAAWTALLLAVLLGGAAAVILRLYGPLAHPSSVLVWQATKLRSIPTDVETGQKTTPLSAGLVAVADSSFLGGRWFRLAFPNGQTGWVRQEELVNLW